MVGRARTIDVTTAVLALGAVALLTVGGTGRAPDSHAAPPPSGRFAHGAAGTARNGVGGEIAPSPSMTSWPGTGVGGNGGAFAFIGAQYGSLWSIPPGPNNSIGVGYCVMEDVAGEGTVAAQSDPAQWDEGEMARAAALMVTFGGDRVVPYGIDASGTYDVASGEWLQPSLFGGGEYTRRRQIAVNFGVKMFLDDVSPSRAVAGLKLARDTEVVNGSGGDFPALRSGYAMAQRMATTAEIQHAVGGVRLQMVWATPNGDAPTTTGTFRVNVHATDATGKPVGFVPVVQLSQLGIGEARSAHATASADDSADSPDDIARRVAAEAAGWPTWDMGGRSIDDDRFAVGANPRAADVTDAAGIARFDVTIDSSGWELAFHSQAPGADVTLYSGTGVQGQVTWGAVPQSALVHDATVTPGRFVVRKVLDRPDVQGARDMSGFVFQVVDEHTDANTSEDATTLGTFTTRPDGRTPPIEATAGDYRIVEVGRPPWASGLGDGGPVSFLFDPVPVAPTDAVHAEVDYTNVVPVPTLTTAAHDASDGDRFIDPATAATIIDTVAYTDLVPGTTYRIDGELMLQPDRGHEGPTMTDRVAPTGIRSTTSFMPSQPNGSVDVRFDLPAGRDDLGGAVTVVYERISVDSSGRVLAEHVDPDDPTQTIFFPSIDTSFRRSDPAEPAVSGQLGADEVATSAPDPPGARERSMASVGSAVVDTVRAAGLDPGERYRLDLTLHERHADGTCVATGQTTSAEFETTTSSIDLDVAGITIERGGVFVAFERLVAVNSADANPTNGSEDRVIATHEDCGDPDQTIWVPTISTTSAQREVTGSGSMTDAIVIDGLVGGRPPGATFGVQGGLFRHDSANTSERTCDETNETARFDIAIADLDGPIHSPGETHEVGWYSYDVAIVVAFDDGSTWASEPHGCRDADESFAAIAPPPDEPDEIAAPPTTSHTTPTTTTTTTTTATPTTTVVPMVASPKPTLARTGDDGAAATIGAAMAMLLMGGGLLIVARTVRSVENR